MVHNNTLNVNLLNSSNVKYALANSVPEWCRDTLTVFITMVFFLGIPGNSLVILVQAQKARKTVTDWFVLFVAMGDMGSLLVCIPTFILVFQGWWEKIGSTAWCKFHFFVLLTFFITSTFLITFVSIDRYRQTFGTMKIFTPIRALYASVIIYIVVSLWNIPALFVIKNNALGQCIFDSNAKLLLMYLYGTMILLLFCSCLFLSFIYIQIIHQVRKNAKINPVTSRSITDQGQESIKTNFAKHQAQKITLVIGLVTFVFLSTTIISSTASMMLLASDMNRDQTLAIVIFFLSRFYMINNCVNPLFYLWLYPSFRNKAWNVIRCKAATG